MPAFFFLFLWYPVAISSSATCRQLVRLEALCIQKHPQCQAANARQLLLVSSTESCSPPKKKSNVPPIWHTPRVDFVPAGVQRVGKKRRGTVMKTENKLSPSTDYYRGRCLEVWLCVLRNMCGLALLYFFLTHSKDGYISSYVVKPSHEYW